MQPTQFCTMALFILACCRFKHLNGIDISALSSFVSPKSLSCYKCNTLTSSTCLNISQAENHENLIEECGPKAKGCVKQVVVKCNEKLDGTKVTFRECYYAKISTFLFKDLVCENIARTASYEDSACYKCSGNNCNSGNNLSLAFNSWLNLIVLLLIAFVLRM